MVRGFRRLSCFRKPRLATMAQRRHGGIGHGRTGSHDEGVQRRSSARRSGSHYMAVCSASLNTHVPSNIDQCLDHSYPSKRLPDMQNLLEREDSGSTRVSRRPSRQGRGLRGTALRWTKRGMSPRDRHSAPLPRSSGFSLAHDSAIWRSAVSRVHPCSSDCLRHRLQIVRKSRI